MHVFIVSRLRRASFLVSKYARLAGMLHCTYCVLHLLGDSRPAIQTSRLPSAPTNIRAAGPLPDPRRHAAAQVSLVGAPAGGASVREQWPLRFFRLNACKLLD